MKQCAIIVDPLASGRFLPDEFASRGIDCIALFSQPIPAKFQGSYFGRKFRQELNFDGDFDALLAQVRKLNPLCIAVGLETGLELTDRLARALGLPGNNPDTTAMRRDKYEMHETLRAKGIRSIRQCRVDNLDSAKTWLLESGIWPVIVKPTTSAGSDDVHLCHDLDDALNTIGRLLGGTNVLGGVNQFVLLQEYLEGREWVVDTVSCKGQHVTANVSRYLKRLTDCSRIVYQHTEFFSPDVGEFPELMSYTLQVNDALGIEYGAAHHEIIMTKNGPVLVEVNTRMHGYDATEMLRECCHAVSQVDLTVDCHVAQDKFFEKSKLPLKFNSTMIAHFLISKSSGIVTGAASEELLRSVPSYRRAVMPKVGQKLDKTISLTSSPGHIWLANDDADALWRDQEMLLTMEADGRLYQVASV